MKCKELIQKAEKAGWRLLKQNGSHRLYEKDGEIVCIPFTGQKKFQRVLAIRLLKS